MRIAIQIIACSLVLVSALRAQEPKPSDFPFDAIDVKSELDRKLIAYGHIALLRERGLTCTPFAGTTDQWILNELLPQERFLRALNAAESTSMFSMDAPAQDRVATGDDIVHHYQRQNDDSDKLMQKLTPEQKKRLPGVYLHTEGLIGLCRPDFAKLFDKAETPARIRKMANETWTKKASEAHRTIFGQPTRDFLPILEFDLRQISYRLDMEIVNILSKGERTRLADLISKSSSIQRVARGAPAY